MGVCIALDGMGGDHGPDVVVPAAVDAVEDNPTLNLILVGDRGLLTAALSKMDRGDHSRISIEHATQRVEMSDLPSQALRNKKDSSMRVAINLVKSGVANACVSAGNTGALMATSRFVLKMLPGIDRPAIISSLPSIAGHTHVLDLGANVENSPHQLFQFAVMGSVIANAVDGIENPRVGLLNIGEEEIKGNERVKDAGQILQSSPLNYVGFIEGNNIFDGSVDVVVCDGFVGNVALKASEGVAHLIGAHARQVLADSLLAKAAALVAMPVLRGFKKRFDPRVYNGASFVGLRGTVIKSHGGADALAFSYAIREAIAEIEKKVPERIEHRIHDMLVAREAI